MGDQMECRLGDIQLGLAVLQKLRPGDKLCTVLRPDVDEELSPDKPTIDTHHLEVEQRVLANYRRCFTNDGRQQSLHFITSLLDRAKQMADIAIRSRREVAPEHHPHARESPAPEISIFVRTPTQVLEDIKQWLIMAESGAANLLTTYSDSVQYCTLLSTLVLFRIRSIITNIQHQAA